MLAAACPSVIWGQDGRIPLGVFAPEASSRLRSRSDNIPLGVSTGGSVLMVPEVTYGLPVAHSAQENPA